MKLRYKWQKEFAAHVKKLRTVRLFEEAFWEYGNADRLCGRDDWKRDYLLEQFYERQDWKVYYKTGQREAKCYIDVR